MHCYTDIFQYVLNMAHTLFRRISLAHQSIYKTLIRYITITNDKFMVDNRYCWNKTILTTGTPFRLNLCRSKYESYWT